MSLSYCHRQLAVVLVLLSILHLSIATVDNSKDASAIKVSFVPDPRIARNRNQFLEGVEPEIVGVWNSDRQKMEPVAVRVMKEGVEWQYKDGWSEDRLKGIPSAKEGDNALSLTHYGWQKGALARVSLRIYIPTVPKGSIRLRTFKAARITLGHSGFRGWFRGWTLKFTYDRAEDADMYMHRFRGKRFKLVDYQGPGAMTDNNSQRVQDQAGIRGARVTSSENRPIRAMTTITSPLPPTKDENEGVEEEEQAEEEDDDNDSRKVSPKVPKDTKIQLHFIRFGDGPWQPLAMEVNGKMGWLKPFGEADFENALPASEDPATMEELDKNPIDVRATPGLYKGKDNSLQAFGIKIESNQEENYFEAQGVPADAKPTFLEPMHFTSKSVGPTIQDGKSTSQLNGLETELNTEDGDVEKPDGSTEQKPFTEDGLTGSVGR